jgi:hypothetical protein
MQLEEHLLAAERDRISNRTADAMLSHAYAIREQPMLRTTPITAPRWLKRARDAIARLARTTPRAATPPASLPEATTAPPPT